MKGFLLVFISCFLYIYTFADIGPITGPTIVCTGSVETLSNTTTGGTWTSSNTSIAAVGYYNGAVYGTHSGVVTISYTAGGMVATRTMYVAPYVLPILGTSTVCTGNTLTLSDSMTGGTWTTFAGNASVTDGVVSGVTAGPDTVYYTMTYACGTAIAKKAITVNPSPVLEPILGNQMACNGLTDTLTDNTTGGIWSSSASSIASVSSYGVVRGMSPGTATITYAKFASGCFSRTLLPVTVNALPTTGVITGSSGVCVNAAISLTDTLSGGVWSATNGNGTITSGGVFTGLTAGLDTIMYSRTNLCATVSAKKYVTVYALPVAATIISPRDSVCINAYDTLQATLTGGIWGKTNSNASISTSGVVKGLVKGIDTIKYTMTSSHGCPSAVTTHAISVLALPVNSTVTGTGTVCAGMSVTLADASPGGVWSNNNLLLDTVDLLTGVVKSVAAGKDTITYTISNYCGSVAKTKTIVINPLPDAGIITGTDSNICVGAAVTLSNSAGGGGWSRSNTHAYIYSSGVVKGVNPGLDTIRYIVSSAVGCGRDTTSLVVTVNPLPNSGTISGPWILCMGTTITLHDNAGGGIWLPTSSDIFVSDSGVISPFGIGNDTVLYVTSTLLCGSDTAIYAIQVQSAADCRAAVVDANIQASGFKLFPNPVGENTLYVETGEMNRTTHFVITDLTGRSRSNFEIVNGHANVDVSALPGGVYIVTGFTADGQMTGAVKLVRE